VNSEKRIPKYGLPHNVGTVQDIGTDFKSGMPLVFGQVADDIIGFRLLAYVIFAKRSVN